MKEKLLKLAALAKAKSLEAQGAEKLEDIERLTGEAQAALKQYNALKAAMVVSDEVGTVDKPILPTDEPTQPNHEERVMKAVNVLRFGVEDDPTSVVMREIYGDDYRQKMGDQGRSFKRFLKTGEGDKVLSSQLWGVPDVVRMLKDGLSVKEIKATMIEGQDTLGGYAVPPQVANEVIARAAGLTVMRQAGATIVQTASKMIEWLRIAGHATDARYPTAMTGEWGNETKSPAQKNFTFELQQIPVHLYTYKVDFSQSLLEDASNVVQIFTRAAGDTLAVDEDQVFLVGDGAGKPKGLLPDSANGRSLATVVTGSASALTWQGLRDLRRGIPAQYRGPNASFIMESDSGKQIEQMVDALGHNYVEVLNNGDKFLGGVYRESEAMPTIALNAFPVVYGDMSAYVIVERLGMAIQRYNDSNMGINVVEFQLRRRIGGDLLEAWKVCLQKVAAS
jgi:HK97 family phage major capsid protein